MDKKEFNVKFGDNLKRLRHEKEKSQQEVADATGIGPSTLSRYEKGAVDPTLSVANKLSAYYGISVEELLGEKVLYNNINEQTARELYGLDRGYIKAIKIASQLNVSPDDLIKLIEVLSTRK